MGKGTGKTGSKHSYYSMKRRCEFPGCKKKAKHISDDGKYYCKKHGY